MFDSFFIVVLFVKIAIRSKMFYTQGIVMTKIKTSEAATTSEHTCSRCKKTLLKTEFHRNSRHKNGASTFCKQCQIQCTKEWQRKNSKKWNEYQKAYYHKNYEKLSRDRRRRHAKTKFGISLEEYEQYCSQPCCEICAVKFDSKNKPHLDHCHASGHIRGVLCASCNRGLGHFKDNSTSLQQAIAYLETHKIQQLS
jgi:hypothetical protein